MSRYYRTYLQLEKYGAAVVDTIDAFGMYCMENPFKTCSDVKEPTKRTWHDEHGDDEYIPADGLRLAAYENKVKFGFKGGTFGANDKLKSFLRYLRSGSMKMYCEFNRIGRCNVRLKSVEQDLYRDVSDGEDILVVGVTFKFNNPTKDVIPVKSENGGVTDLIVLDDDE